MATTNLDALSLSGALTVTGATDLITASNGLIMGAGTSGANHALGSTAGNGLEYYLNATHTTGDMHGSSCKS